MKNNHKYRLLKPRSLKLWLSILLVFLQSHFYAQDIRDITFRNYLPVENIDSLQKSINAEKDNPVKYLTGLLQLENSRCQFNLNSFGNFLQEIDSLSAKYNMPDARAGYFYFLSEYIKNKDRIKSLACINKALDLYTQKNDTSGLIHCYIVLQNLNIDNLGRITGDSNMAKTCMNRLTALADKSSFPEDKLNRIISQQRYYYQFYEKKTDTLFKLTQQALGIIQAYPELQYLKTGQLNFLAAVYYFKKDYLQALHLHLACLAVTKKIAYKERIHYLYNTGNDYHRLNNPEKAEFYYKEAIRQSRIYQSPITDQRDAIKNLTNVLIDQHKYEEACDYFQVKDSLSLLIQQKMRMANFSDMQVKYETEKKETANKVLQKQKQSYETGILISLVLLSIISLLLFYLYNKNKQLDEYAHFRDKIFTIISHDLRSPILALEGLSKQSSYLIKKRETERLDLVAQKIDSSVLQMNSLLNNLLAWSVSQNSKINLNKEQLPLAEIISRIVLLYADIAAAKHIDIKINVPDDMMLWANKNGMETIIRNLIDNAIKNTSGHIITINAQQEQNNIVLWVTNNNVIQSEEMVIKIQNQLKGKQLVYLQNASGFGLQLIAYFIKLHKGSVTMKSNVETGTVFTVVLPA